MDQLNVKRGDIFYADLSPVIGSEQGGVRPVLVVQNDIGNRYSPTVIISALTAQVKSKLPTHVEIRGGECGLSKDSVILLEQLRTIDKMRLERKVGHIPYGIMEKVDEVFKLSLGIKEDKPMNQLTISEAKPTIDSREIAVMMEINHWEILRKLEGSGKAKGIIPTLTGNKIVVSDYFIENSYKDESGKANKCYLFTKMGCEFIANKFTGEKGILFTAKYVQRFNKMESVLQRDSYMIENPIERAKAWIAEQEEKKLIEFKVKELAPAAEFGNAIGSCGTAILIGDFAKVLANDGIKIGRDRLFAWLQQNKYIYRDKDRQLKPYQNYVDQGIFRVKESKFSTSNLDKITITIKVTGKGQKYFYEKLKDVA